MIPGPHFFFGLERLKGLNGALQVPTFSFFGFGSGQSDAWISLNGLS